MGRARAIDRSVGEELAPPMPLRAEQARPLHTSMVISHSNDVFTSINLTYQCRNSLIGPSMQLVIVSVAVVPFIGVGVGVRGDNPTG